MYNIQYPNLVHMPKIVARLNVMYDSVFLWCYYLKFHTSNFKLGSSTCNWYL